MTGSGFFKVLIYIFILTITVVRGQKKGYFTELKQVLDSTTEYDDIKRFQIESIKSVLKTLKSENLIKRYDLNQQLFNEYKVFNRDSAFHYGLKARNLALEINNEALLNNAKINLADISVSAGMFKEALDFLESVNISKLTEGKGSIFYGLLGRCYSDMAEYSKIPYFSREYNKLAKHYRERALTLTQEGTFFNSFLKAFNKSKNNQLTQAINNFKDILHEDIGERDKALVNYMLGNLFLKTGEKEKAVFHFAEATIEDLKTSTKESLALIKLSELLFNLGEVKNASILIHKANEDAIFYGSQQRKIQVSAILPLIDKEIVKIIELEKNRLYWQYIIVSFFLIIVVVFTLIIYRQFIKLKKAKKIIALAHTNLKKTNTQLRNVNNQIKEHNIEIEQINKLLLEANKIKEEYLGFFFTQYDNIFEKFNFFKLNIEKSLNEENYDKVRYHVSTYNLKREKEKLLNNFDTAFIKLFPNFIKEFNSLMKEEHKIELKNDKLFTNELRIFALIRLGVKHSEIIAQILGYSVNSIYAYKTKVRNKSIVSKDEFDQKLLDITTLKH